MIACTDKEDCRIKAEKHLYEYYDRLGKIANKYRYVNFNTLEVELPQNKTFIIDTKQFSIKKYGKEEALRLAIETRREFNHAYNCLNG
jgi:hypothetical protein